MREYQVKYTPRFLREMGDIYELILLGYANFFAATSLIDKIKKKCQALSVMPKASAVVAEVAGYEFRFTRIKSYTIIYYVDDQEKTVHIVSIQYSRRDIIARLKDASDS